MTTKVNGTVTINRPLRLGETLVIDKSSYGGHFEPNTIGILVDMDTKNDLCRLDINGMEFLFALKDLRLPGDNTPTPKVYTQATKDLAYNYRFIHMHKIDNMKKYIYKADALCWKFMDKFKVIRKRKLEYQILLNSKRRVSNQLVKQDDILPFIDYLLGKSYASINIDKENNKIIAITKPINIVWNKVAIDLGYYKVVLDTVKDNILVEQQEKTKIFGGKHHPHISSGRVCFGSIESTVIDYLTKGDYLEVLSLIANFLSSGIDSTGWYITVIYWAVDADKRCHNCWELKDKCKCKEPHCNHCGRLATACRCIICPRTDELVGTTYDDYCRDECDDFSDGRCHYNDD